MLYIWQHFLENSPHRIVSIQWGFLSFSTHDHNENPSSSYQRWQKSSIKNDIIITLFRLNETEILTVAVAGSLFIPEVIQPVLENTPEYANARSPILSLCKNNQFIRQFFKDIFWFRALYWWGPEVRKYSLQWKKILKTTINWPNSYKWTIKRLLNMSLYRLYI